MARWFYTLILHLLLPLVWLRVLWRGRRAPGYAERTGERFGKVRGLPVGGIVIHAVSFGETQAAQPLVNALRAAHPELPLLITSTTATGAERVRSLWSGKIAQCWLPYDYPWALESFLDACRPRLFIVMETELWPNLLAALKRRGIPVLLANARLSERSAQGYGRFAWLTRPMLASLTRLAAQDADTARRFEGLGMPAADIRITGSLKFDLTLPEDLSERVAAIRRDWNLAERQVWVASSTHDGEDEIVLDAHRALRADFPDLLLLLVPRHPERFYKVSALVRQRNFNLVRRSDGQAVSAGTEVFLGDSMGEMLLWCALADVAFVGGSFVKVGGHNPLEAAALCVPVVTGPEMFNFQQIADRLAEAGALVQADSPDALVRQLSHWLGDYIARQRAGGAGMAVVDANRGALSRHMALVDELLRDPAA